MKKLLTFLCALLFTTAVQAQPARLVMMTQKYLGSGGWVNDTTRVAYVWGSSATGNIDAYWAQTLRYDTSAYYSDGILQARETVQYNQRKQRDVEVHEGVQFGQPFDYLSKYHYFYNAAGDVTWKYAFRWNKAGAAWDSAGYLRYTYDANGRLVEELDLTFSAYRLLYTYDAAGNMLSQEQQEQRGGLWMPYTYRWYSYDAAGNCDTTVSQIWDGTAYENYFRYIFMYNGTLLEKQYEHRYNDTTQAWRKEYVRAYTYDAAGKKLTDSSFVWTTTTGDYVYAGHALRYTYNVWGLNDTIVGDGERHIMEYGINNWLTREYNNRISYPYDRRYFYVPVATESVASTPSPVATVTLYPNPARDVLQLSIVLKDSKPCTAAIYDYNGRLLRQWQEKTSTTRSISVSDLQAGTYILTISNGAEKQSQQFVVAR